MRAADTRGTRHDIEPPLDVSVSNASEAIALLRMLPVTTGLYRSPAQVRCACQAVIAWIAAREEQLAAREREISDIEHGAAHLMLQIAEQVGKLRKAGRM